jgi:hypothetical protein
MSCHKGSGILVIKVSKFAINGYLHVYNLIGLEIGLS